MRLRWDWLEPAIHAPYVPTLGPVAPGTLTAEMFHDIIAVSGTGRFLPYDKDRRWSDRKDEHVLTDQITHSPTLTVIPTLSIGGCALINVHHYGAESPDLPVLGAYARELCARYGAAQHRITWCQQSTSGARTRLMLKTFTGCDRSEPGPCMELSACPYEATFPAFAQQARQDGFMFLHQRMKEGHDDGPILVAVEDNQIVGALGPLSTLQDRTGVRFQPPQYFAVHPAYRGRGHGRALWRASMAWGHANGAAYKILQAAMGSPAEQLYLSEGIQTLGFIGTAGPLMSSSRSYRRVGWMYSARRSTLIETARDAERPDSAASQEIFDKPCRFQHHSWRRTASIRPPSKFAQGLAKRLPKLA